MSHTSSVHPGHLGGRWYIRLVTSAVAILVLSALAALNPATSSMHAAGPVVGTVNATGDGISAALEDRVEVIWTYDGAVDIVDWFEVTRDGELIHIAASTEALYEDFTAAPGTVYEYCVELTNANDSPVALGCSDGSREIATPTGLEASSGAFEDYVSLSWTDNSEIESGYNVYRTPGNALDLDGIAGYVQVASYEVNDDFTFDFWARRHTLGTEHVLFKLETFDGAYRRDMDMEIFFDAGDRMNIRMGAAQDNTLTTPTGVSDMDWHHWAVIWDDDQEIRYIYQDGELVAQDVLRRRVLSRGDLYIGRRKFLMTGARASGSQRAYFDGELDEVRVWDVALTAEQVALRMSALLTGAEEGLVNYWPMDHNSSGEMLDMVGSQQGAVTGQDGADSWVASLIPNLRASVGADITTFVDFLATPGFGDTNGNGEIDAGEQPFTYRVAAFIDDNGDGEYGPDDFESESQEVEGWRARLAAPQYVAATDGQFSYKIRITWVDASASEAGYRVYRDDVEIVALAENVEEYEDTSDEASSGEHEYCIAAYGPGNESMRVCDYGRMDQLAAPTNVSASVDVYDDRVTIAWIDPSDTEDGFEIYVNGTLAGIVEADEESYVDRTALQAVDYEYCIRAFSEADPTDIVRSDEVCAMGRRAAILAPTDLVASQNDYEDRVELAWENSATTTLMFKVLRDDEIIEVLDYSARAATDYEIESDRDYEYAVIGVTVIGPTTRQLQGQAAQVLESLQITNAVGTATGGQLVTATQKLNALYGELGLGTAAKATSGLVESAPANATGSRSIEPPTEYDVTFNEFENHVQLAWEDNSEVETAYRISRTNTTGFEEIVANLTANRTTYGDYTGEPGMLYMYQIEAIDSYGASESIVEPGMRTLKPPTQLTATDGMSEEYVYLDWADNSSAETGYHVYRREYASGDAWGSPIASTGKSEPAYIDTLPVDLLGVDLEYAVAAYDDYGQSVNVTGRGATAIEAPGNVNASDVYDGSVVVVWVDRSEVETGYLVTRRKLGDLDEEDDEIASLNASATATTDIPDDYLDYVYCVTALRGDVASEATCDVGGMLSATTPGSGSTAAGGFPARIDGNTLDGFDIKLGWSVAADGNDAVVGAPGGAWFGAAVEYSINVTDTWTAVNTRSQVNGISGYGYSVDVSGGRSAATSNQFVQLYGSFPAGAIADEWPLSRGSTLDPGPVVAIADDWVLFGDPLNATGGGAFVCNSDACVDLSQADDFSSFMSVEAGDQFGAAVDLELVSRSWGGKDDDMLVAVVGAPGGGQDRSRAVVFECPIDGDSANATNPCEDATLWKAVAEVQAGFAAQSGTTYGESVSISGDYLVVGDGTIGGFELWKATGSPDPFEEWNQIQTVSAPDDGQRSIKGLGSSVAIDHAQDKVVVGAPSTDHKDPLYTGSGAILVYSLSELEGGDSEPNVTYDARTGGGSLSLLAQFGRSVAIGDDYYLIGAPGEGALALGIGSPLLGAAYIIPFNETPVEDTPEPEDTNLLAASDVVASDGSAPDRIQVRWTDNADNESGQIIYRSREGGTYERLAEIAPDLVFYDDFSASPGDAYTYCVAAFSATAGTILESDPVCDIGWRPANGTIAGWVSPGNGGATADVEVCLSPSPNKALLTDGFGGFLEGTAPDDADMPARFTIETWILAHEFADSDEELVVAAREGGFTLAVQSDAIRIDTWEDGPGLFSHVVPANVTAGEWHHVAVTRNVDNDLQVYLDGEAVGDEVDRSNLLRTNATTSLRIGTGFGTEDDAFFDGQIDELRIWSYAKSAADILGEAREVLSGDEEGLVGYWPLDQGMRLVAPDVSESAINMDFIGGAYVADDGAPLKICDTTDEEGQFSISHIRYGESTEFKVTPTMETRLFEPAFSKITLASDSPVQNQMFFIDRTAFTLSGVAVYEDATPYAFTCPAPDVGIHASKDGVVLDENLKATTGEDGSFTVDVDPSQDATDPWYLTPRFASRVNPDGEQVTEVHSYTPAQMELEVTEDVFDLVFFDDYRNTLSGTFSGGDPDPDICQKDIGIATLRIYTQDGCYDDTINVTSMENGPGVWDYDVDFALDLPPLEYLIDVISVTDEDGNPLTEVEEFFEEVGTREVDLRWGDAEVDFTYRAPLILTVEGLEPPAACEISGISHLDDGTLVRTIPNVATLGEWELRDLTISVDEDYGDGGTCPVDAGTVTIYDAISDRADADSTISLENGQATYLVIGTSPNIYAGARIGGVDRSFQKPITVVAQVEGRPALTATEWAIVEGYRERSATFVSATTEEFPLLIVHDPPGSESYAYVEEGSKFCQRFSSRMTVGGSLGIDFGMKFGFKTNIVAAPFGGGMVLETGGGLAFNIGLSAGADYSFLGPGPNREVCLTTTEKFTTAGGPDDVGEDIHVGVALNLIFAIADVLEVDAGACELSLSETLAGDIDQASPFETSYVYGSSHIENSLIPDLEKLVELAGTDAEVTGEIGDDATTIRLTDAIENWEAQLENSAELQAEALEEPLINRSFSADVEYEYAEAADTTTVTFFDAIRVFLEAKADIGPTFEIFGNEATLLVSGEIHSEWIKETEETTETSSTIGYVLSDGDAGDYFSVDVAKDPRYGTFVFGVRSGRSSFPWEEGTQKRDNPFISIDPPVLYNVDPAGVGNFELTLTNGSESDERREYTIGVPGELNTHGLGVRVSGAIIGAGKTETYMIDPGSAITVAMDVKHGGTTFSFPKTGVIIYPKEERAIWQYDRREPLVPSDTAFFEIQFDPNGALSSRLVEGWNWFSINRPGGDLNDIMQGAEFSHGDLIMNSAAEAHFDSTRGWTGSLGRLEPGVAYKAHLLQSTVLSMTGDAVIANEPRALLPGWNWVGFLPNRAMPVGDAMASLDDRLTDGDVVVGQHGFSQYVTGAGWVGTLRYMEPGEAYQVFLTTGGDLLYPEDTDALEPLETEVREITTGGPDWEVDVEEYGSSMLVIAEISMQDSPLRHTKAKVAVTWGDEVRGLTDLRWVDELDRYLAFIQVYGDAHLEEALRVHVYDGETSMLYEDVASLTYSADTMLGKASSPIEVELTNAGLAPELVDVPEEFELFANYPNPFNPQTVIAYALPESAQVSLIVYDVIGRRVATLVNSEQRPGHHRVVFDAGDYASGVYLYRIKAGSHSALGRMVLIK